MICYLCNVAFPDCNYPKHGSCECKANLFKILFEFGRDVRDRRKGATIWCALNMGYNRQHPPACAKHLLTHKQTAVRRRYNFLILIFNGVFFSHQPSFNFVLDFLKKHNPLLQFNNGSVRLWSKRAKGVAPCLKPFLKISLVTQ